nr:RNA-directed DNA polymerase, eukaryota [Tanacetum cinerariifolium]
MKGMEPMDHLVSDHNEIGIQKSDFVNKNRSHSRGAEMSNAQIPICTRDLTIITGFCSDNTCENTCKSRVAFGASGVYKGIKVDPSLTVSHFFYPDDAVFIGEWSDGYLRSIMHMLYCFPLSSGLKINLKKSQLLGVGVASDLLTEAAVNIGCSVMKTTFKYLGVMVPKSVLNEMESLRRNFFNGMQDDERKITEVVMRWIKSIPIKINVFAWKLHLDRIPTRINFDRRGVQVPSILCPVCNVAHEDTSHLFFSCVVDTARLICRWWNLTWIPVGSYSDWMTWFNTIRLGFKIKGILEGVLYVTWWSLWNF